MPTRKSTASWNGTIKDGSGSMSFGSGAYTGAYSFLSRFKEGTGTNPEELIGAAHAGCFSMALSASLTRAELNPYSIDTTAAVTLEMTEDGNRITKIHLSTKGVVPGITAEDFQSHAEGAKQNCPVSNLLTGATITLEAELIAS